MSKRKIRQQRRMKMRQRDLFLSDAEARMPDDWSAPAQGLPHWQRERRHPRELMPEPVSRADARRLLGGAR
jgi:hypothetical protein